MFRPIRLTPMPLLRLLGPLILSAACGCADVRVVREMPNGGVVALPMNNNCWPMYYRSRAAKLMRAKCPEGYRIDREEFVWNGKEGPEGHSPHDSYFGYTNPEDETAPYHRKEYHITFHAAPARRHPPPDTTDSASGRPSSPNEDKDELPPPRPLKSQGRDR